MKVELTMTFFWVLNMTLSLSVHLQTIACYVKALKGQTFNHWLFYIVITALLLVLDMIELSIWEHVESYLKCIQCTCSIRLIFKSLCIMCCVCVAHGNIPILCMYITQVPTSYYFICIFLKSFKIQLQFAESQ
jgi:hypothetical protein